MNRHIGSVVSNAGPPIGQALEWARGVLARAKVPEPEADSQWLMTEVTGISRSSLRFHKVERLSADQWRGFTKLIEERSRRKPLPYIIGRAYFFGLEFVVDERVMIPRPETEVLVEAVLNRLRGKAEPKIADIGTGSGAIACALAAHLPGARIWATDLSEDALAVARTNVERFGLRERVVLIHCNLADGLPPHLSKPTLDALVANLPYIADSEWDSLEPEVRVYEPAVALKGGPDGLAVIRTLLLSSVQTLLAENGFVALEISPGSRKGIEALLSDAGWKLDRIEKDLTGSDRVVVLTPVVTRANDTGTGKGNESNGQASIWARGDDGYG